MSWGSMLEETRSSAKFNREGFRDWLARPVRTRMPGGVAGAQPCAAPYADQPRTTCLLIIT